MRSFVNTQDDKTELPWDPEITKKWMPVNAYIGGAEHAVLHLLYARFVWMTLKDWGFLKDIESDEPFPFLFSHGLLIKDGAKMSKSRGNVIIPDAYIKQHGADTLRMYLMFLGPYNQGGDFRDTGILGMRKFLERVWNLLSDDKKVTSKSTKNVEIKLHQTIKDMKEDIGSFQYNTAIARYMELTNILKQETETISQSDAVSMIKLIAPFAPHITEELWQHFANSKQQIANSKKSESIHLQLWPEYNETLLVKDEVTIIVQVNGKMRATLSVDPQTANSKPQIVEKAKQDEKIKQYLEGKEIKKEIFIPGKLVNFVIS
jgi:leucyl-tRNA synthetase